MVGPKVVGSKLNRVLKLVVRGYTYREIGTELGYSITTIHNYLTIIREIAGVRSRKRLVEWAETQGIIEIVDLQEDTTNGLHEKATEQETSQTGVKPKVAQ